MKCFLVALALFGFAAADVFNKLELIDIESIVDARHLKTNPGLSVSVSPDTLEGEGGWVTVSWENVLQPTNNDWIAVYNLPLDLKNNEPSKFQNCSLSPSHLTEGKGSLKFKMLNMRHDVVFIYMTGGLRSGVAIAESNTLSFKNPNAPMQGHLAIGKTTNEMRVTWVTRDIGQPVLRWGLSADKMTSEVAANTTTYKREEMCGAPANTTGWMDPGVIHSALITDVVPNTRYFYEYGSADFGFAQGSFVSPPPVGRDSSFRFFAFGDMGQAEEDGSEEQAFMVAALNTTRLMALDTDTMDDVRLVVHIGDISYARGHGSQWDVFFDEIGKTVSRRLPYMTVPGNHERDWPNSGSVYGPLMKDSGGECGVAYERRMIMPTEIEDEPWYSFDFGAVHFVLISTEHPYAKGTKQNKWVAEDLAAVDRSKTPWIILGGHRPMYIDSTFTNRSLAGDIPVAEDLRDAFEDLMFKYSVDLGIWGHHHSYQRTCPVRRRLCLGHHHDGSARAPVHLVIGMAGYASSTGIHRHRPWYFEHVDIEHHGYSRGFANGTHLTMEFVSDVDARVLDSLTLVKPPK